MNIREEKIGILTPDGVELHATLLIPEQAKAVIQFNCGTATKKEFYHAFLHYFAEHGYICCLWNYRGTAENDNLKKSRFTYIEYGLIDIPKVKNYLRSRFAELPFVFIGHSTGGQQIGFIKDFSDVKGIINIAVSTGYFGYMPWAYKMKAYFFFYLFSPISNLLYGYVKAKPLGIMENLPTPVVNQWRDWCQVQDYYFDKKYELSVASLGSFKQFTCPIEVFNSIDDSISSPENTKNYWKHIASTKAINIHSLVPSDFDVKSIDHFGYFKRNMKESLWSTIRKKVDLWIGQY